MQLLRASKVKMYLGLPLFYKECLSVIQKFLPKLFLLFLSILRVKCHGTEYSSDLWDWCQNSCRVRILTNGQSLALISWSEMAEILSLFFFLHDLNFTAFVCRILTRSLALNNAFLAYCSVTFAKFSVKLDWIIVLRNRSSLYT